MRDRFSPMGLVRRLAYRSAGDADGIPTASARSIRDMLKNWATKVRGRHSGACASARYSSCGHRSKEIQMSNLVSAANRDSKWTRFWRFLRAFDEAVDVSEVEILQRRVRRLEKQMAELKNKEADSAAGAKTLVNDRTSH
jgi:hypothetical protein